MEFLKKHYEKVLLSVVLLGLGVAALWPTFSKQADDGESAPVPHAKGKPLPALSFEKETKALTEVTNPRPVVLSGEHRLFAPATWKRLPDGAFKKILVEGPDAITVKKIAPLYMIISYDRVAGTGYYMNVQLQSGTKKQEFLKVGEKSKSALFTLRDVKGAAEDPSELIIELNDSHESVSIKKDQPFQRVDGYTVDMKYDPDNKVFNNKRVNDLVPFAGDNYKIVYITNNEVRVTASLTQKQTTISWTGTP